MYNRFIRGPLIEGKKTYSQISREILRPMEDRTGKWWFAAMTLATLATLWGVVAIYVTVSQGIGTWGVNNTVAWGWAIVNFVWWIGIGHAGTAFSIFLLILRQKWRTSINRSAEAMTVVAVGCAALFPALHMGRVWLAFFIFPYPNTRGPLWVNFNSPLFWDFSAITAYLLISFSFWYLGMLPDFATIRDRAKSKIRKAIYGFFAMGWTGSSRQWVRFDSLGFHPGRHSCCSRGIRAFHRGHRFRGVCRTRLAYHHLSAIFCYRGDILRFCHGDDPDGDHEENLSSQ